MVIINVEARSDGVLVLDQENFNIANSSAILSKLRRYSQENNDIAIQYKTVMQIAFEESMKTNLSQDDRSLWSRLHQKLLRDWESVKQQLAEEAKSSSKIASAPELKDDEIIDYEAGNHSEGEQDTTNVSLVEIKDDTVKPVAQETKESVVRKASIKTPQDLSSEEHKARAPIQAATTKDEDSSSLKVVPQEAESPKLRKIKTTEDFVNFSVDLVRSKRPKTEFSSDLVALQQLHAVNLQLFSEAKSSVASYLNQIPNEGIDKLIGSNGISTMTIVLGIVSTLFLLMHIYIFVYGPIVTIDQLKQLQDNSGDKAIKQADKSAKIS